MWLQEKEATCQGMHGCPAGFRTAGVPGEVGVQIRALGDLGQAASALCCYAQSGPNGRLGLLTNWWQGQPGTDHSKLSRSFTSLALCSFQDLFPSSSQPGRGAKPIPKGMLLTQEQRAACLSCLPSTHTMRDKDGGNKSFRTGMLQEP